MLPFGSITSVIPLFVFALAYVLYFGTSVLSRNKASEHLLISGNTEKKEISAENNSNRLPEKTFTFSTRVSDCIAEIKEPPQEIFYRLASSVPRIPDDIVFSQFSWSGIFSRPPPLS
jgi:hypothetical protein